MPLLVPPMPVHDEQAAPSQVDTVGTPVSRTSEVSPVVPQDQQSPPLHPQISLRVFASYYTIIYLFLLVLLVHILSVPYFLVVLFVLLLTLFYCILRHIASG